MFAIEPDQTVRASGFQNVWSGVSVAQLLSHVEILLARDWTEGAPVFCEVILKKMFGAKSLSTR
jgi:hypothetical protein